MSQKRNGYGSFAIGLLTGAGVAAVFALQLIKERDGCEPVVDVEYKRVGRGFYPETVVRRPVRDGNRCILSEASL